MTDKDPKDMTVSEQLRWAANGEPYNGIDENIWTYPTGKIRALAEAVTGEWPSDNEIFSIVADKTPDTQERIDADARKNSIRYWGCEDFSCDECPALIDGKKPVAFYELDLVRDSCSEAQKLDLLRRQRELDAKGGE